jgi:hypothetical protein
MNLPSIVRLRVFISGTEECRVRLILTREYRDDSMRQNAVGNAQALVRRPERTHEIIRKGWVPSSVRSLLVAAALMASPAIAQTGNNLVVPSAADPYRPFERVMVGVGPFNSCQLL